LGNLTKFTNKILSNFGYKINKLERDRSFPVIEVNREIEKIIKHCSKYSLTGYLRMYVVTEAIRKVLNDGLEGDFVECGVWKGGNLILMEKLRGFYKLNKKIYGYDTFDGMSEPTELDEDFNNNKAKSLMLKSKKEKGINNIHCFATIEDVKSNIISNCDEKNISLIKGPVEETLLIEENLPKKISVLRLDTDFYESTKIELDILFPLLVKGGILIIDDYGHWKGAKKAVDEYFADNKHWLHFVDYTCRYLIKV